MDALIRDILCLHPIVQRCQAKGDIVAIERWEKHFQSFDRDQLKDILAQLQEENNKK